MYENPIEVIEQLFLCFDLVIGKHFIVLKELSKQCASCFLQNSIRIGTLSDDKANV